MPNFTFFCNNLEESKAYRSAYKKSIIPSLGTAWIGNGLGTMWVVVAGSPIHSPKETALYATFAAITFTVSDLFFLYRFVPSAYEFFWGKDLLGKLTNTELEELEKWYLDNRNQDNFEQKFIEEIVNTSPNFGTKEYTLKQASEHLDAACQEYTQRQGFTA